MRRQPCVTSTGNKKKKTFYTRKELFALCKTCAKGMCCREGVDVDLEEAKVIAQLKLDIKKPWFEGFFYDTDLPSKWGVSTVVRDGTCVFQDKNSRCRIYKYRPHYCREFPIELGSLADLYEYLCEMPTHLKREVKTQFRPRPRQLKISLEKSAPPVK